MIAKYLTIIKSKVTLQFLAKLHKWYLLLCLSDLYFCGYGDLCRDEFFFSELPITSCFLCVLSTLLLVVVSTFE